MNWKLLITISLINAALFFGLGTKFGSSTKTEIKEVVVTKTQERVRTVIKELPGGEKTTIIESVSDTFSKSDLQLKYPRKDWSVWAGLGANTLFNPELTYIVGVDRYMAVGFSLGGYVRTDKEFGLYLRYEF